MKKVDSFLFLQHGITDHVIVGSFIILCIGSNTKRDMRRLEVEGFCTTIVFYVHFSHFTFLTFILCYEHELLWGSK